MKSTMFFARYILFGLFVVCNAIICTVAVWNHSLVQATGSQTAQVDVYLIFLGAFSLAFIFPIIFADLLCTDPFSARVWIECAWVALIWLMQLGGAAAVTAIAPHIQCSAQATKVNHNSCLSTNVLVAFTWICTIILLLYLSLLVVTAVTTQAIDPGVWHHNVRYLRIETTRQCLPSAQNSPTTPRFVKGRGTSVAHKPRSPRPVALNPDYGHRAGLDSEYEIEHYRPHEPQHIPVDSALSLPEAPSVSYPSPALVYSQRIRGLIPPQMDLPPAPAPSRLNTSITYSKSLQSSIPAQEARASPPSPSPPSSSPFDWPRANIMEQPIRTKRKPPPSAFEFPSRSAQVPSELPSNTPLDSLTHPRTRRPSGPRVRPPSADETQHPAPYLAQHTH
ncbi:hypothetical protein DFJ58DRAFT_753076 [Suillus subalutaceus]|uniref:uncharacterized protein n=1 Tax=Suillus subalutaceus TaxID=48586 RepID=UPI001B880F24|nr:uncharacterized protein DFJ58DRAFT_753076 [Suillus subalutaceus]KAG1877877.1 hypothetical protein DFJ58DRAFT_753076 [Suillus subalutaceus]